MSERSGMESPIRRNNIKSILYIIGICMVMQSCGSASLKRSALSCSEDDWVLEEFRVPAIRAVGRVKIDLPKYRIRGICRIEFDGRDVLAIDFKHSSLFGAYEEDALIRLSGGELTILDRERDRWFDTDSSLAMLTRGVGFDLYTDDLLYALLLALPECSDMTDPELWDGGDEWRLVGEWRGRRIELEGGEGRAIESFSFCPTGDMGCYTMSYRYDDGSEYPNRISIARDSGRERITFDIVDRQSGPDPSR